RECAAGDVVRGIYVGGEDPPGWDPVEQFNAAQLNEPMALGRIEACRFSVENDFAHGVSAAASLIALLHCSYSRKDFSYLRTCSVESFRCIHDEISALSFFRIRHLV